jgi:NTE family protein
MRLGLVLSGGGANGAFEAGVVAAIEEAGLTPSVLSGTSAGALNVAGMAHGLDAAALAEVWRGVRAQDVFRLRRDVWRALRPGRWFAKGNLASRALSGIGWTWLLETSPLRATLQRVLDGDHVTVQGDLAVSVSAVEKATGALVRFTNALPPPHRRKPSYRQVALGVDHLMASAAIPLAFRPAELDGRRWWDGGIVANTPLAPAMAHEPDAVIVVTTATRERPAPQPETLDDAIGLLIDNVLAHSLAADLERARLVNDLCRLDPGHDGMREVEILVIEPAGLEIGGTLDFDPALAERRLELGLELGRQKLATWAPGT